MNSSKIEKLTIGNIAKLANVGVETVRFYERKGIIKQPEKLVGRRIYSEDDTKRIRFVKKMQELGFSLNEIKDFLHLTDCEGDVSKVVKEKTNKKVKEIKDKISDLKSVLSALDKFSDCCGTEKVEENCELLECFENDWNCCL